MPNLYSIEDTTLTGLANAIRSQTGESSQLSPSEMISDVTDLVTYNIVIQHNSAYGDYQNTMDSSDNGIALPAYMFDASVLTNFGDLVNDDTATFKLYVDNNLICNGSVIVNETVPSSEPGGEPTVYQFNAFQNGALRVYIPVDVLNISSDDPLSDTVEVDVDWEITIHKGTNTFTRTVSSTAQLMDKTAFLEMMEQSYPDFTNLFTRAQVAARTFDDYTKSQWLSYFDRIVSE